MVVVGRPGCQRALATRARDAAVPLEERRGGARGQGGQLGLAAREHGDEPLPAPGRMPSAERQQRVDHGGPRGRGRSMGTARVLEEAGRAVGTCRCN